jgi:hypothetical protein
MADWHILLETLPNALVEEENSNAKSVVWPKEVMRYDFHHDQKLNC